MLPMADASITRLLRLERQAHAEADEHDSCEAVEKAFGHERAPPHDTWCPTRTPCLWRWSPAENGRNARESRLAIYRSSATVGPFEAQFPRAPQVRASCAGGRNPVLGTRRVKSRGALELAGVGSSQRKIDLPPGRGHGLAQYGNGGCSYAGGILRSAHSIARMRCVAVRCQTSPLPASARQSPNVYPFRTREP